MCAANVTGLARSAEYKKTCFAIAETLFLQRFVSTLWDGNALQSIAALANFQSRSGEFANLAFGQLTRFSTGMNAGGKQNLASQVIAKAREKRLVQIDRVQRSAGKCLAL